LISWAQPTNASHTKQEQEESNRAAALVTLTCRRASQLSSEVQGDPSSDTAVVPVAVAVPLSTVARRPEEALWAVASLPPPLSELSSSMRA
jgi:hypothetical protein